VLLDRQSLIVSYDERRVEPRGKLRKGKADPAGRGDCVDCKLCVTTCPTGIDIRSGLQMECIGCAQCIDACDAVMDKIGRSRGLIRYSSQQAMDEGRARLLRPRVVVYPLILAVVIGLFGVALAGRGTADVSFLRNRAIPYRVLDSGSVSNVLMVKIANRTRDERTYDVTVLETAEIHSSDLPLAVAAGESAQATIHVVLSRDRFERGRAQITVRVTGDDGFNREFRQHVLGPLFGTAASEGASQ
jgi:cytochrome c oxidase accessory protein FixG